MKKSKSLLTVLSITILVILWGTALAAPVASSNATYSFNTVGPNTSGDPSSGETIQVTGDGSFDAAAGTVVASGSFAKMNSSGSVIAHGSWKATAFVSFTPYGGPNPGIQGGQLVLTVTLFSNGGAPQTGVSMSVTCLVGSPPPGAIEGVTVGDFTQVMRGRTLFHLNV